MSGDLRLLCPAVGCWLTVVVALCVPLVVTVVLVGVLVLAGVAAGVPLWSRRTGPSRSAILATIAGVCGICAAAGLVAALRITAAEHSPLLEVEGKSEVTLTVTGDPLFFGAGGRARLPVRVQAIGDDGVRPVPATLHGDADELADLLPGQHLSVLVRVRPPRSGPTERLQAAQLTAVGRLTPHGRPPVWQRAAGRVRVRLAERAAAALDPESAGLLPGLILGDTSRLDQTLREDFRAAGLTHLTAVSGANFSLLVGTVVLGLQLAGASTRTTVLLGLVAVVGFVILVRPTDSVLRAAVMGGVGLLGALAHRRAQALPALGAAIVLILLCWPQMALTPGFALSVVATLGLVLWAAPIRQGLTKRGVPRPLAVLLAMTLAAQIFTTPVIIAISGRLSLVSVPANLLVAPIVGVITLLGTAAALLGALGPPGGPFALLAELLLRACTPEMWWLCRWARWLGSPSWAAPEVPGLFTAALCAVVLLAGWWAVGRTRRWGGRPRAPRGRQKVRE